RRGLPEVRAPMAAGGERQWTECKYLAPMDRHDRLQLGSSMSVPARFSNASPGLGGAAKGSSPRREICEDASLIPDPRIDVGVRDVNRQIRKHQRNRAESSQAENQKMVAIVRRVDKVRA